MTRIFAVFVLIIAAGTCAAQPTISIDQTGGTITYAVFNACAPCTGLELFNLVNFTQHNGTGPIFGLGLLGSEALLTQILSPVGTEPFHVTPDPAGTYSWQVIAPATGTTVMIDVVCVVWHQVTGYVSHSSVLAATLTL